MVQSASAALAHITPSKRRSVNARRRCTSPWYALGICSASSGTDISGLGFRMTGVANNSQDRMAGKIELRASKSLSRGSETYLMQRKLLLHLTLMVAIAPVTFAQDQDKDKDKDKNGGLRHRPN